MFTKLLYCEYIFNFNVFNFNNYYSDILILIF